MSKLEHLIEKIFDSKVGDEFLISSTLETSPLEKNELKKFVKNINKKSKILDLGCGKGKYCKILSLLGYKNLYGIDISQRNIELAITNVPKAKFIHGSATDLPYKKGFFDAILCVAVLEHIPNVNKAISEMSRVLKVGGEIFIFDKNYLSLHHKYFIPTMIWKFLKEKIGKWVYPTNFPFTEKYFIPCGLKTLLSRYKLLVKISYVKSLVVDNNISGIRKIIVFIHNLLNELLYFIFPFFSFYVIWKGKKIK